MKDLNAFRKECWPTKATAVAAPTINTTATARWRRVMSTCPRNPLTMVAMHMKLP
ncbi:hypothetical protein D3C87_1966710 [compost metagenome]